MTPVLGALIGIVTTLIIVAVVIVLIVRTRDRDDTSGAQLVASSLQGQTDISGSKTETTVETKSLDAQEDERSLSLVSNRNGNCFYLEKCHVSIEASD